MDTKNVTSTEFQTRAGQYLDEAAKMPIFITKHARPTRVLIDIELFERFLANEKSTQEAYTSETAPEEHIDIFLNAKPSEESKAVTREHGDESDLVL